MKAWDLISNCYRFSLMTSAVLPASTVTWINPSFNRKSNCFWTQDIFLESIFIRATKQHQDSVQRFSDPPSSPLVFASSALFSWISLSCTLLFFSWTLTQSFCVSHKGLSRDPNQTGVFCSLTLLITLLVNMQQQKHHFLPYCLWASTISCFAVFACLCAALKRLMQWVYNSVA